MLAMSPKRKCRLSPDSFCYTHYVDTIWVPSNKNTRFLRARSLSLHTVLTLECLSATKTKHGLLMFAVEVVGRRWKDGYEAK